VHRVGGGEARRGEQAGVGEGLGDGAAVAVHHRLGGRARAGRGGLAVIEAQQDLEDHAEAARQRRVVLALAALDAAASASSAVM
jgi:hypothetical protein